MIIKGISDNIVNQPGEMHYRNITVEETIDRRNYREADNIDYRDGDIESSIYYLDASYEDKPNRMYEWGVTTLISNRSRVYKGGSWSDRAYYIQPAVRRYLDERQANVLCHVLGVQADFEIIKDNYLIYKINPVSLS